MAAHKKWRLTFPNAGRSYVTIKEMVWKDSGGTSLNAGMTATASSIYSNGWEPSVVLDGNTGTTWANTSGQFPAWIGFYLPSAWEPASVEVLCGPGSELPGVPTCAYGDDPSWSGESPSLSITSGSIAADTWVTFAIAGPWTAPAPITVRNFGRQVGGLISPPSPGGIVREGYFLRSYNLYFGGKGKVYGYVDKDNAPGSPIPLRRKVVLHRMRDNLAVALTISRASDGYYEFLNIDATESYYTVAFDNLFDYRMVGADNLIPEVMV